MSPAFAILNEKYCGRDLKLRKWNLRPDVRTGGKRSSYLAIKQKSQGLFCVTDMTGSVGAPLVSVAGSDCEEPPCYGHTAQKVKLMLKLAETAPLLYNVDKLCFEDSGGP